MEITFVNLPIEYYSPVSGGAISTVIMQTARALCERGHRVSVLTPINEDEVYPVGEVFPVQTRRRNDLTFLQRRVSSLYYYWCRWDWPYFEHYLASVVAQLRKLPRVQDIIVLANDLVSPAILKREFPEAKIVAWMHNEWRTRFRIEETIRATDLFIACSNYIRAWTIRAYRIPFDKFAVVHNAVDHDAFHPVAKPCEVYREVRVLYVGRIDPNKGPDLVADVVAVLRAEGLSIQLTVAGGRWFYGNEDEGADPYVCSLKEKVIAAGGKFLGHVPRDRVPELFRSHDVVCVLSRSQDPFPLVTYEAMASGCAVIASNRGGLPEACVGAGLLVDPDDFQAVVGALRSLVVDRDLLAQEKQRSLARAASSTWLEGALTLEKLLL